MSELTLNTLIQLLALLAASRENSNYLLEQNIAKSFLQNQFRKELINSKTKLFNKFYLEYVNQFESTSSKSVTVLAVKLASVISRQLSFKQRIFILINLTEFSAYLKVYLSNYEKKNEYFSLVKKIGSALGLEKDEIHSCFYFARGDYYHIKNLSKLLILSSKPPLLGENLQYLQVKNLDNIVYVLDMGSDFCLIKYEGKGTLYINDKSTTDRKVYFFLMTSSLRGKNTTYVYFNDFTKYFQTTEKREIIQYFAKQISYCFPDKEYGIHTFDFHCISNELIGILGGSGSGKTTLINLLQANLPSHSGEILLNNHNLADSPFNKQLFGYIPQDDLLFSELTVYDNLYYRACLSCNYQETELHEELRNLLDVLGLFDIKDLTVGSPDRKVISGGQRKRLNIALELIRKPKVLFADEPTSGLSSTDASKVIQFLRQYALLSNIVLVNIHQPSNEILYSFNKILILDKGGYPIYFGKPGEALSYFRSISKSLENSKLEGLYPKAEEIFRIVEETEFDESGDNTTTRVFNPQYWYEKFIERSSVEGKVNIINESPNLDESRPKKLTQFWIYLKRNLNIRSRDIQYRYLAIAIMPFLALILSWLCKQFIEDESGNFVYRYYNNENIASFLFLSTIATMFVGLIISAEDLIKEKRMWQRDRTIGNSRISYYSSKLVYYIVLGFFQSLSYAVISYGILKIAGSFMVFWTLIFITLILANVIGLILSATFKTIVSIYIMIPILLIPQILLSGVVVKFDQLNPLARNPEFVPIISDLMPIRWTYEAMVVNEFKNNEYQSQLFDLEMEKSKAKYQSQILIPQIRSMLDQIQSEDNSPFKSETNRISLLKNELVKLNYIHNKNTTIDLTSAEELDNINKYLNAKEIELANLIFNLNYKKDLVIGKMGGDSMAGILKAKNTNKSVESLLLNQYNFEFMQERRGRFIQKVDPVYHLPDNSFGRAHYYAAYKKIGNEYYDTILFNICILLLMTCILFFILVKEYPQKLYK